MKPRAGMTELSKRPQQRTADGATRKPIIVVAGNAFDDPSPHYNKIAELIRLMDLAWHYWEWDRKSGVGVSRPPVKKRTLFRGGGKANKKLLMYYPFWMMAVFWAAIRERQAGGFICMNFNTAFPLAVASLFAKRRFVFLNNDNLHLSYRWPRPIKWLLSAIERFTVKRADVHIIPGWSRWHGTRANTLMVPNSPTSQELRAARRIAQEKGFRRSERFTLYVNGLMTASRGIGTLVKAIESIPGASLEILVAGELLCSEAVRLSKMPIVSYLGVLSSEESLAVYYRSHLVFTFYDPAVEISRIAEPNKWQDCIATNTTFVANEEIQTLQRYVEQGACFSVPYDDHQGLARLLVELSVDQGRWERVQKALAQFKTVAWDQEVSGIIDTWLQGLNE